MSDGRHHRRRRTPVTNNNSNKGHLGRLPLVEDGGRAVLLAPRGVVAEHDDSVVVRPLARHQEAHLAACGVS